jgi:hypothetical protein
VCFAALLAAGSRADVLCSEAADPDDAGIVLLRCPGVVIAAEASAVRSPASLMSAHPRTIQLDDGVIAISAGSSAPPFATLTPDAVVIGLDGEWAVVAELGRTRAVVRRGTATVRLRADHTDKGLPPGDAEPDAADRKRMDRLSQALERRLGRP